VKSEVNCGCAEETKDGRSDPGVPRKIGKSDSVSDKLAKVCLPRIKMRS
jgi:hypothetical protein